MKRLFCFLFACVSVLSAMADDSATTYPEDWTYGNIYVKEPNQSIALEKEYMFVSGDKIKAVFCFRNTTDSTVVVPCAFPIVVKMPFRVENDTVMIGDYFSINDFYLWDIAINDFEEDYIDRDWGYRTNLTKADIENYDKKLRVLTYNDYQKLYKKRGISPEEEYYKGCNIYQDGNAVELKTVGIETNVSFKESKVLYGEVELVLHFYHELKFQPDTLSKVCVDYLVKSITEDGGWLGIDKRDIYYDIYTGGNWKNGVINSFVLLTDYNLMAEGLKKNELMGYNVYSSRNYKPIGRFHFWRYEDGLRTPVFMGERYENQISLNKKICGDSTIKYELVKNDSSINPFIVDSTIYFSVSEPCVGPFVANGFLDMDVLEGNITLTDNYNEENSSLFKEVPTLRKDSLWQNYSRIKTAFLTNVGDGRVDTLKFEDSFPYDGWSGSNAVRNVCLLCPGEYKFAVSDIYKGDSTESVGVSHIWFYPVDKTLVSVIDEDKNSTMPLFSDVWKILNVTVDGVKPNWNDEDENGSDSIEIEEQEQKQESPAEQQVVKTDADESKSAVLFVVVALVALSVLAVVIVVVRKRKSRSK
ncbi:MAG: hypothetical protein J6W13_12580 [Salinivirgaceae bacterium]|nr:hypothetical protein [Salinivirgaceae bacterium]